MNDALIAILVVGGILTLVIAGIAYAYHAQKKRTEAMGHTCEMMGFSFTPVIGKEGLDYFSPFGLFNAGHSRKGRNLMKGKIGEAEVILLDYQYTTGGGKHQHTHSQTVVVVPDGAAGLPTFQLAPENFFHKIGQWFGYHDIDFEGHEAFSKAYLLRGPKEESIRQTFTAEALEYFGQNHGWSVQTAEGQFLAYRAGKSCNPEKCPEFVAEVLTLQRLFAAPGDQKGSSDGETTSEI